MKQALYFAAVVVALCLVAIATKPTDSQVRKALAEKVNVETGNWVPIVGELASNSLFIRIENHLFYKEIYTTDGSYIGSAFLTQIIIN
jgi:hypothetical protein